MNKLFEMFKQMLLIHLGTKTTDALFHEKTAAAYELLFDIVHEIGEKMQDIEKSEPMTDLDKAHRDAYDIMEKMKAILEAMVKENKDVGMDNLLRGLLDKVQFQCGNLRGFLSDKKEEAATEGSDTL